MYGRIGINAAKADVSQNLAILFALNQTWFRPCLTAISPRPF